ncbi:MAG: hypothetical protein M0T70_03905 [Geobacteraceae bacterium]|nr:hypothetical protein [Geobacteraceae bacterium]
MNNFIFSIPTTVYFGKGHINILGETINKAHGAAGLRRRQHQAKRPLRCDPCTVRRGGSASASTPCWPTCIT